MEQSARERETSTLMHRVFQHDLYLLRLNTARSFVRSLQTSSNPISTGNGDESESIKLSAQAQCSKIRKKVQFWEVALFAIF